MAKSTPQTKPNLFGALTQKPEKKLDSPKKNEQKKSVSIKQEEKTSKIKPDSIHSSTEKNKEAVAVTTNGKLADNTSRVITTTKNANPLQTNNNSTASSLVSEPTNTIISDLPLVEDKPLSEIKEVPFSNREGTNHASLLLTKTNFKFLRIRTRQLGTTLQKYVDLLLHEEKDRWNDEPGYADTIYDYCENRFKEEKKVMSLITSKEGNDFLNEGSIEAGIKKVTFMNYIISREIERENSGKKRESM